ncbi:MAG: hypothetical protein K6C13_11635 [Oscillospiraceae bacterium]|nr:hypothetical protein [Oscillospiraceae bacterium]
MESKILPGFGTMGKRTVSTAIAALLMMSPAFEFPVYGQESENTAKQAEVSAYRAKSGYISDEKIISNGSESTSDTVTLNWLPLPGTDGYRIYRFSEELGKFKEIADIDDGNADSYTDTGLEPGKYYVYRIKAYTVSDSIVMCGQASDDIAALTKSADENYAQDEENEAAVTEKTENDSKQSDADINDDDPVVELHVVDEDEDEDEKDGYKKPDISDEVRVSLSDAESCFGEGMAILSKTACKPHNDYTLINTQGSAASEKECYATDADIDAIERFAAEHFESDWTAEQKAAYTCLWINRNVTYAYGDDWNVIGDKGFAEAIFDYRLGQCAQYNGAMIEMLNYLGFDADLVLGYRGTSASNKWQHYWGEIEIDGTDYVIETGCYKKNGDWMYLAESYDSAGGYLKFSEYGDEDSQDEEDE